MTRRQGDDPGASPMIQRPDTSPTRQGPPAPKPRMAGGHDRGAATVWLLAAGLVLIAMGVAAAAVGSATVARHRAQTAADLGALAGAIRAVEGAESACARATEIVTANGGRLTSCTLDGFDVTIAVEVSVSPLRGIARSAHASARAGPIRASIG
jgi:secretion/DNA translocation related TadE-like protein